MIINTAGETSLPKFKHGINIEIAPDFSLLDLKFIKKKQKNPLKIFSNSEDVVISNIKNIINKSDKRIAEFLGEKWEDKSTKNIVWNLHNALSDNISLIYVPKKISAVINIRADISDKVGFISLFILADSSSDAKIIFTKSSGNASKYLSEKIRVIAEEKSTVDIACIQKFSDNISLFQSRKSTGKKNSSISWTDIFIGGKYLRSETVSLLNESEAEAKNRLIYLSKKSQKSDFYTSIIHNSKNTYSDITTKGVVMDKAKALSRSLIKINPNARGSEGYEKQEAIIIGDEAEADAIPDLEIENSDVKCSHGSTIGTIDNEKIFYMMSRGLSEKEAKNKIIEGYFAPVLDAMNDKELAIKIKGEIADSLK